MNPSSDWSNDVCGVVMDLFTWRWMVTNFVVCLLHVLMLNERIEKFQVFVSALSQESIVLLIGLLFPSIPVVNVLFLFVSILVFERLRGEKLSVRDDFTFASDLPCHYFKDSELVKTSAVTGTLKTDLKCLVPSKRGHSLLKGPLPLDQIYSVSTCVENSGLSYGLERMGYDISSCFQLTTIQTTTTTTTTTTINSSDDETSKLCFDVVFVAGNADLKERWVNLLKTWIGFKDGDVHEIWLRELLGAGEEGKEPSDRSFTIDDALGLTNQIARNFNPIYLLNLFESFQNQQPENKNRGLKLRQSLNSIRSKIWKEEKIESKVELNWNKFVEFFRAVVTPTAMETVFKKIPGRRKTANILPAKAFQNFLREVQREMRHAEEYLETIKRIEPVLQYSNVSVIGVSNYLLEEDQSIFNGDLHDSMDEPLSHYFVASSHNTYLTKDQLKSKSSVDMYIKALQRGCKCLELDCWDGADNEPVIYHGFTLTSKISFKEVIQAVKEHAFDRSPYPVILSLEIHCSIEQQKTMVKHFQEILGDILYLKPIPADECYMPSPNNLKGYIIIKSKKMADSQDDGFMEEMEAELSDEEDELLLNETNILRELAEQKDSDLSDLSDIVSLCSLSDDDEHEAASTPKEGKKSRLQALLSDLPLNTNGKSKNKKAMKIAKELSDLVVYCQAKRFKSFDSSKIEDGHFEMCSLQEKKALRLTKESALSFTEHNKRHLTRVYPSGHRIDSSNYNPVPFWNVGCQMVALNYQTACKSMQLNQGLFQMNSFCGYVLKPHFLRKEGCAFDPQATPEKYMTLSIRIISGHQLPFKNASSVRNERGYVVQTRIFGVEVDCQTQQTMPAKNNGLNPIWDEVFLYKIHVPDLAMVMFTVCSKSFVAQYSLPVRSLKRGCRRVPLLNKHSEMVKESFLLVHVEYI